MGMERAPKDQGHIRALDGVRGAAFLLVFGYHSLAKPLVRSSWIMSLFKNVMLAGWVGVDLFFVLSGFLITTILLDAKGARNYLRVFYARRALRIFPLYYLVLALAVIKFGSEYSKTELLFYWLNLSNLPTAFGMHSYSFLTYLWSLGIEEQFYLVWPALVLCLKPRKLAYVCVGVILGIFIAKNLPITFQLLERWPELVYRLTLFRVDTLCGGALLALIVKYRPEILGNRTILRAIFLVSLCIFIASGPGYTNTMVVRFGYSALVVCFAALIALTLFPDAWESQIFSNAVLRRVGKYSYALYLMHVFVIGPLDGRVHRMLARIGVANSSGNWLPILVSAIDLCIAMVLAALSWKFFEGPIMRLKRHFRYSPRAEHYLA